MKSLLIILALAFSSGITSCQKCHDDPCIDRSKIDKNAICTMEYDPVCGCDGITYGNPCDAGRNGVKTYTPGECNTENR